MGPLTSFGVTKRGLGATTEGMSIKKFLVIAQYIPPCYNKNKAWGVKMNLVELVQVTSSEEEAEKFLRAKGILKTFDRCPFCGHQKIGKVRRSFFKCYGCRKEWSIRKDSIASILKSPLH